MRSSSCHSAASVVVWIAAAVDVRDAAVRFDDTVDVLYGITASADARSITGFGAGATGAGAGAASFALAVDERALRTRDTPAPAAASLMPERLSRPSVNRHCQ